ncbi:Defensin-like protein [Dillenia turbinata]|uniref:Defensin-like protein n=1 Tax=Dillenia turbinata TaxID=194707 RepID=A0AAN8W302_9MAGN
MATSTFSILVLLVTVVSVIPRGARGRHEIVLDPTSCELAACRQKCLRLFQGTGLCVYDYDKGNYACVCFADSNSNETPAPL